MTDDPKGSKGAAQAPTDEPLRSNIEHIRSCAELWEKTGVGRAGAITRMCDEILASRTDGAAEAEPACEHLWVTSLRPDIVQGEWCHKCKIVKDAHPTSRSVQKPAAADGDES